MVLDLVKRGQSIFHRIVQQRRHDGIAIELERGQDTGDFEWMGEIGIAAGADLRAVRLEGENIGAVERAFIRSGIVSLYALDQFILANH